MFNSGNKEVKAALTKRLNGRKKVTQGTGLLHSVILALQEGLAVWRVALRPSLGWGQGFIESEVTLFRATNTIVTVCFFSSLTVDEI